MGAGEPSKTRAEKSYIRPVARAVEPTIPPRRHGMRGRPEVRHALHVCAECHGYEDVGPDRTIVAVDIFRTRLLCCLALRVAQARQQAGIIQRLEHLLGAVQDPNWFLFPLRHDQLPGLDLANVHVDGLAQRFHGITGVHALDEGRGKQANAPGADHPDRRDQETASVAIDPVVGPDRIHVGGSSERFAHRITVAVIMAEPGWVSPLETARRRRNDALAGTFRDGRARQAVTRGNRRSPNNRRSAPTINDSGRSCPAS